MVIIWLFYFFIMLWSSNFYLFRISNISNNYWCKSLPIDYIAQVPFTAIDSLPIMAIPFFIAAGVLMGAGGLSKRLLNLADYMSEVLQVELH